MKFIKPPIYSIVLVGWLFLIGTNASAFQSIPATAAERIKAVETGLLPEAIPAGDAGSRMSLVDRMKAHQVPGVSIVVIHNYKIDWAKSYGVKDIKMQEPVNNTTLFQVGSISKAIVAMATLALVEQKKIDLDADVNQYLKSWKLPDSRFSGQEKVTVRRILSHSAGLRGEGYPGYGPNEKIPSLIQILDGTPPAKSKAVRLDTIPGVRWRYSGGGYLVLQQLLMDVTQKSFPDLIKSLVFKPLKMKNSSFAQPLSTKLVARAASGHQGNELEPGRWRTIPQVAAGGLWSTAPDLALFLIEVQKSGVGKSNKVLSASMTEEMLKPHIKAHQEYWSLGFNVGNEGQAKWFEHGALTDGYICDMIGFVHNGDGIIILTNSESSYPLIKEIIRGVATTYNWPAWKPQIK